MTRRRSPRRSSGRCGSAPSRCRSTRWTGSTTTSTTSTTATRACSSSRRRCCPALESELESRVGLHVLVVDGDPGPHASFDAVARERGALRASCPPPTDTHREDMAFWLYSSGSTGRPKGVVHAHGDIGVTVDQYARNILEISAEDVCYSTTKLFHAYGLGNALTFPLSVGACAGLVKGRSTPGADLRCRRPLPPDAVLLGARAVRGDGQGARGRARSTSRACARAYRRPRRFRPPCSRAGRRSPASRSSTESARPRCSTSTARTRSPISPPGHRDDPCPGTSCGSSTSAGSTSPPARRAT